MAMAGHPEVDVRADHDLPLRVACRSGRLPLVQWLVESGGAAAAPPDMAPFLMACVGGHLEVAKWLHERAGGLCPLDLHRAFVQLCAEGTPCVHPVARWLLDQMGSVDAAAATAAMREGVMEAADGQCWHMVHWVLLQQHRQQQGGVDVHVAGDYLLRAAVDARRLDVVRWLLAQDPEEGRWPAGNWVRMLQTWTQSRDAWIRSVLCIRGTADPLHE